MPASAASSRLRGVSSQSTCRASRRARFGGGRSQSRKHPSCGGWAGWAHLGRAKVLSCRTLHPPGRPGRRLRWPRRAASVQARLTRACLAEDDSAAELCRHFPEHRHHGLAGPTPGGTAGGDTRGRGVEEELGGSWGRAGLHRRHTRGAWCRREAPTGNAYGRRPTGTTPTTTHAGCTPSRHASQPKQTPTHPQALPTKQHPNTPEVHNYQLPALRCRVQHAAQLNAAHCQRVHAAISVVWGRLRHGSAAAAAASVRELSLWAARSCCCCCCCQVSRSGQV